MERSERDDVTDGPGNVTVDEPTEPALNPDDDDLQDAGDGDPGNAAGGQTTDDSQEAT